MVGNPTLVREEAVNKLIKFTLAYRPYLYK